MLKRVIGSVVALCALGLAGCSSNSALVTPTSVSITITAPANTRLFPGQTAQFSATVSNASNTSVYWEVNNVVHGNAQVGTITDSGLYTAPSTLTASTTVTITAAAEANTSESATATVTLVVAPTVSVSPPTASVYVGASQPFTATVGNSTNIGVTWQVNGITGGNATYGTISATGVYTAPGTVPTSPVTVTAVSSADSNATGSATVTVLALPPVVTVTPPTATVPGNTTQQFTAAVTNTTNTAVTWEVNDIPGGNSTIGTISSTGLYTAPSAIPNPATVTVMADSVVNPSSIGVATVTITTPEVVVVSPPSATVQLDGTQQFTATSSIPNDTLTWQVNGVTGGDSTNGTISSNGLYTAPSSTPTNPIVVVKAISGINPAIFGSATVSIGTTAPSVTVSPGTASVAINTTQPFTATVSPSNLSQTVQWQVDGISGGNSTVGTISTTGVYTAPLLVPNPAAVTISAVSGALPNLYGTATVTVTLPSSPISVTVTPPTANLITGQSQAFSATVSPNNNPNVTWTVSGTAAGCTPASASNSCGSIDTSGNYTAPTSVPGGGQSANVTVTATSAADPTKSGTATVTITPAPAPSVTITATSTAVCSKGSVSGCSPATNPTFTAVPHNFPANAQIQFNWTLGCINTDEDADYCGDPGNPTTGGDNGSPELDGPGDIQASGGGTAGSSVTNSTSVVYLPPTYVFQGSVPAQFDGCSSLGFPPGADTVTKHQYWGYVPLTVVAQDNNGNTATSQVTCIEVIYQYQ